MIDDGGTEVLLGTVFTEFIAEVFLYTPRDVKKIETIFARLCRYTPTAVHAAFRRSKGRLYQHGRDWKRSIYASERPAGGDTHTTGRYRGKDRGEEPVKVK